MADLSRIRAALEMLPAACRYHGDNIDPSGGWRREACCDTGIPAMRRRQAEQELQALEREQVERGEVSINDFRRSQGLPPFEVC